MAPSSSTSRVSATSLTWRPTKIMHMRDLSKDDDFLSHLLVEKLGTGSVPLLVHKMDSSRKLPRTGTQDLMRIVRRLVVSKGPIHQVVRQAVDELLTLTPILYYLKSYTQKQINAFATHASRYFELYHPSGCIEIAHTSRYSHFTGKSELCILATRNLSPGTVITELKGSMANLTDEEDKELKRVNVRNSDIRRDFSVIHSKSMKKNHLFLGPARFVNHDCDNNCELFREGRYITFRVIRQIALGEEITAHYGDGYFGKKNRRCLCETCEKNGRGGYSPDQRDREASPDSSTDSDSDSDSETSSSDTEDEVKGKPTLNVNERRTRRGVYAITKPREDSDDSDNDEEEEDDNVPLAGTKNVPADNEIELIAEIDAASDLTSLPASVPPSDGSSLAHHATSPSSSPTRGPVLSRCSSSLTELSSSPSLTTHRSGQSTPFRSIMSTRHQKAKVSEAHSPGNDVRPIESVIDDSPRRITRSASSLISSEKKGNGNATPSAAATPTTSSRFVKKVNKEDSKVKKEEPETRTLRGRTSVPVLAEVAKDPPPKPEPQVLRGADGKPLPLCATCKNILPLISVDHKIIWGLETSKKKNQKQDCPRCLRHLAIYGQSWPSRVAPRGTISVTPREDSAPPENIAKRVSHKVLPLIDRRLKAAAASASVSASSKKTKKRRREEMEEEEEVEVERPLKRRESAPEVPLRKATVTKTYGSNGRRHRRSPSPEPVEEPIKRKRGRPRLSSSTRTATVKVEDLPVSVERSGASQPRSTNGRFGRKDRSTKRNAESVSGRSESSGHSNQSRDDQITPKRKRRGDCIEILDGSPRKRTSKAGDTSREAAPVQKVLPRPASGFRGGRLFSNPNPLRFALHAWAGPVVLDDSSSEDEKHPETPEDDLSPDADIIITEQLDSSLFLSPTLPRAPLTHKPSPFTFAKSRWNGAGSAFSQSSTASLGPKVRAAPPRRLNVSVGKQIYGSDGEASDISVVGLSSPLSPVSDVLSSDDDAFPAKLRHVYPVLPARAATTTYPKRSTFTSGNSDTKPNFINAGWDDASTSDISDA